MKNTKNNNDPYTFDLDNNDMPVISTKNIDLVNALTQYDPAYRISINEKDERSSVSYIKKANGENPSFLSDPKIVLEIVKRLDKENSTHLSVKGSGKEDGRFATANYICKINDLKNRLEKGEPELVNEIAQAVDGRNNFSFASKFCAFVSRALFEGEEADHYCIYDQVLCEVLPYYAWYYLNEKKYKSRKNSAIETMFKDKKDYVGYIKLIDRIREKAAEKTGVSITRKDFDLLLWFYFRGDKIRIREALDKVPASASKS